LTQSGAYTGTIALYVFGQQQATGTFNFQSTGAATIPTGLVPTLATFTLPASQNTTSPDIVATLTPATINAGDNYRTSVSFNAPSPSGVVWSTNAASTTGAYTADQWSNLSPAVGYWCGNQFVSTIPISPNTFPQNSAITVGGITITHTAIPVGSNSVTAPAGNAQFTSTVGSNDVATPVCTSASFGATTVNSATTNSITVTTVCADSGAGLSSSGVFIRATANAGFHFDFIQSTSGSPQTGSWSVPKFQAGTAEIIGVYAVDQAGNAIVYGSCGDLSSSYSSLCGGGGSGSSALVASFAVVVMCILAVLAL
jgi:hypothetical protein